MHAWGKSRLFSPCLFVKWEQNEFLYSPKVSNDLSMASKLISTQTTMVMKQNINLTLCKVVLKTLHYYINYLAANLTAELSK